MEGSLTLNRSHKGRKRATYSQYFVSAAITSVALRHVSCAKLTVVRYAAKVPLGTATVGDIHLASESNWCGLVAAGGNAFSRVG